MTARVKKPELRAGDPGYIAAVLKLLIPAGEVIEIRALAAKLRGEWGTGIVSGYFNDWRPLEPQLGRIEGAAGIYFTPNQLDPALLARSENCLRLCRGKEPTTNDRDIIRRRYLLIDCDPARPAGISSSDAEHRAALDRCRQIEADLSSQGWPNPIAADSGNGGHLLYEIDLPAADDGLVERCLDALAIKFDDESVKVDRTVHNPARICKLYGTIARKGSDTRDRPHRLAKIIRCPSVLETVPLEMLETLAAMAPSDDAAVGNHKPTAAAEHKAGKFNLAAWIAEHFSDARGPEEWQGGKRWVLAVCPFDESHTGTCAAIMERSEGGIAYKCHHASCADHNWHALRDKVEPGWRDAKKKVGKGMVTLPADVLPLSDRGMADRLAKRNRERLRYMSERGMMMHDGLCWRTADKRHLRSMARELPELVLADQELATSPAQREAIVAAAKRMETTKAQDDAIKQLSGCRELWAEMSDFNQYPNLLNALNGTIDLRTGEPRPHDPADMLTGVVRVDYDPDAKCPTWERFLDEVAGQHEGLPLYLQVLCGLTLTGEIWEQLWICHGPANRGKSTLWEQMGELLGEDYCVHLQASMLKKGRDDYQLVRLMGKRLGIVRETTETDTLTEDLIKNMATRDKVTARDIYHPVVQFQQRAKNVIVTNELPQLRAVDDAVERRVRVVPFDATMPPLREELQAELRQELPGILAWAVAGAISHYEHGLGAYEPDIVRQATQDYLHAADRIRQFAGECLMLCPITRTSSEELYLAYCGWARSRNYQRKNADNFSKAIRSKLEAMHGVTRFNTGGQRGYHGIRLTSRWVAYCRGAGELGGTSAEAYE